MKKLTFLLLASILVMTSFSCGGSGGGTDTSPAPKAANDSSYKGVYKGVLSGSTGHFYIDAYNTDATKLTLVFTFDGVSKTIEGTETMSGSNYVYTFSDGGYVMVFEVTPTGTVLSASFTFTGHADAINVDVDKTISTKDVSVWEGTWVSDASAACKSSGTWNMVIKGSALIGSATLGTTDCHYEYFANHMTGTVTENSVAITVTGAGGFEDAAGTGTISGSSFSGHLTGVTDGGTLSGTKTL